VAARHEWITATSLASSINRYLAADQSHGQWLSSLMHGSAPLLRDFWFDEKTWTRWLSIDAPSSQRVENRERLDPRVSSLACELVKDVGHRVDRLKITDLATAVVSSYQHSAPADVDHCVRLWVATRLWGGGASDGRVPWNTRRSLLDPELGSKLQDSVKSFLTTPELRVPDIDGAELSYASKWLWALGTALGGRDSQWRQAYILDDRVRATLGWLAAYEEDRAAGEPLGTPHGRGSYQAYCALVAEAAEIIKVTTPTSKIDGEKIEWLLFSGSNGESRSFRSRLPL